ncbi:MAG: hypothetical protein Q7T32_01940 [Moraxellaceae bacterium]|nr:hypothetical protein [Moraxellaceae bacterium]
MKRSSATENVYIDSDAGHFKSKWGVVIFTSATAITAFCVAPAPQAGALQSISSPSSVFRVDELPKLGTTDSGQDGFPGISVMDHEDLQSYLAMYPEVRLELGVAADSLATLIGERRHLGLELFVDPEEGVRRVSLIVDLRHVEVDEELVLMDRIYSEWLHPINAKIGVGKISIRAA